MQPFIYNLQRQCLQLLAREALWIVGDEVEYFCRVFVNPARVAVLFEVAPQIELRGHPAPKVLEADPFDDSYRVVAIPVDVPKHLLATLSNGQLKVLERVGQGLLIDSVSSSERLRRLHLARG